MVVPRWHRPLRTILEAMVLLTCVQPRDAVVPVSAASKDSASDYFSVRDSIFNGSDVAECFGENLVTCLKVSLLGKVTRLLVLTREQQLERSTELMGGLVTLETTGEQEEVAEDVAEEEEQWDSEERLDAVKEKRLNQLLIERLTTFFKDKALTLNFVPGLTLRVLPAKTPNEFVRLTVQLSGENLQQVMARTMKMGGMMRSPWMMIGPMITLGMFPFMLANLKYMVMNAFMINNMALMMALRTTVTNLVFGDNEGDNIVYRNKGYSNEYKNQPYNDHHPVRYTVKPYNQINKYRKVFESRPSSKHPSLSPHGGDHQASASNSLTSAPNDTSEQPPVKYIAHHDYFGRRRPSVSVMGRPGAPVDKLPVKYIAHHDYSGASKRPPGLGERTPVKYIGENVQSQSRPVVGGEVQSSFHGDSSGKFEPSSGYYPVNFHEAKEEILAFSPGNHHFTPTNQVNSLISANPNNYFNTLNHLNHQSQGMFNKQHQIPPNHKNNEVIGDDALHLNYFDMQSRADGPLQVKTSSQAKTAASTAVPPGNSVVDRDQNSWVAKGEDEHWPIIYQDPTTFQQEVKIKSTEVGTVFPVFPGEPENKTESKHSVQVSSGIRFEGTAPVSESSVKTAGVGLGAGGYFGHGEVISVSPHGDRDPALIFEDSVDLTDENEFVNFPQRLIQIQPGQQIDRRLSKEPQGARSAARGTHRKVVSSVQGKASAQSSFPEALWMFRE